MSIVVAFSQRWLSDKPKPEILVPDNARSYTSRQFQDFCSSINVWVAPPAEAEAWASGIAESTVQDIKETMEKIQMSDHKLSPETCLALATGALNQTSFVKGFSSYQWAYGKQFSYTDEDEITMPQLREDAPFAEFSKLLTMRHVAEQKARETRAQRVLSKLQNTISRQPLKTFAPTTLVKVWRRALPHELHRGTRGGTKKAGRNHWIGPGRVVLHETLPHQESNDPVRHIIWVVIGGKLYRCSAHSVRPVTEQERAWHHLHTDGDDPRRWRSLQDIVPSQEYTDLASQELPGDRPEDFLPDLPERPDSHTWVPSKRLKTKQSGPTTSLTSSMPSSSSQVNDYTVPQEEGVTNPPDEDGEDMGVTGLEPLHRDMASSAGEDSSGGTKRPEDSSVAGRPDGKKSRIEDGENVYELYNALQVAEHGHVMEMDLNFSSHRQLKKFLQSPSLYLVGKMRDCEVRWERLRPEHKALFTRAKTKEVSSFIKQAAVRKCLDQTEEHEAHSSGRIMKCRWVLTWKEIPQEEREEAVVEASTNAMTTIRPEGDMKAKARIVLLGYQHPDLLKEGFSSSAPVQSVLARNLSYMLAVTNGWELEGLDLATAFLQTAPKEEMRIWTHGVAELRSALGLAEHQLMRVLKDFYGSTTAPRGLWQDLNATFVKLGGTKIMSDPCVWVWSEPNPDPRNPQDANRTIGFMGGHVDDFNRAGDLQNPRWLKVRQAVDQAYSWGTIKKGNYRHAGTDIESKNDPENGYHIVVHQDQYIEGIPDFELAINSQKAVTSALSEKEISMCRGALGALQWVAVNTQPLLCARCNLILSDLANQPTGAVVKEIQQLICEVRRLPHRLVFKQLPGVYHWQDVHVITLGDQAHNNRPRGGSTGGILTFLGGPAHARGDPGPLVLLGWKTWRLQRVAIGSTDAEVQAMVEAEDINFKTRLLWAELNSSTVERGPDFLEAAEKAVMSVPGILGTDSKGGYDAITRHEGPDLGLSNSRAAIQGHQLKEGLRRALTKLIWLASDWNLSDALTKRPAECRRSLEQFLRTGVWMLKFDPHFVVSAKKAKHLGLDAASQMRKVAPRAARSKKVFGPVQHLR